MDIKRNYNVVTIILNAVWCHMDAQSQSYWKIYVVMRDSIMPVLFLDKNQKLNK